MCHLELERLAEDQWYYLPAQEARAIAGASPSHQARVLLASITNNQEILEPYTKKKEQPSNRFADLYAHND